MVVMMCIGAGRAFLGEKEGLLIGWMVVSFFCLNPDGLGFFQPVCLCVKALRAKISGCRTATIATWPAASCYSTAPLVDQQRLSAGEGDLLVWGSRGPVAHSCMSAARAYSTGIGDQSMRVVALRFLLQLIALLFAFSRLTQRSLSRVRPARQIDAS